MNVIVIIPQVEWNFVMHSLKQMAKDSRQKWQEDKDRRQPIAIMQINRAEREQKTNKIV